LATSSAYTVYPSDGTQVAGLAGKEKETWTSWIAESYIGGRA